MAECDISTTFANRCLDWMLAVGTPTRPSAVYLGLGTGSDSTGVTGELSGNGYARQTLSCNAAASRATSNSALIEFGPDVTTDWGTVTHAGVFDALTGGNCIYAGSMVAAKTVSVGDKLTFPVGNVDIVFDAYAD